ncbi:hypothetical protein AK812_SmicGene28984 [Symbiodinium microadriaticum]|uniref:Sperm-tail PG-rich repeat-containing protein 2 n=2 Tax=Symbiodinium TaxID=2949 RepID=A0A1Q9D2X2_SYMMI|nr:hypothetical protein AK812_SmicGene28984 [Symbiodinium microadriaticum]
METGILASFGGAASKAKAAATFAQLHKTSSLDFKAALPGRLSEASVESAAFVLPGRLQRVCHPLTTCLSHHKKAPKWSFAERCPDQLARPRPVPGPGTYEVSAAETAAKTFQRPPKFSFGSAGRNLVASKLRKETETPGPGAYGGHYTTFGY